MHILVTGGTGFIGSALCPALLADQHQLTLLTRKPQKAFALYGDRVNAIKRLEDLPASTAVDAVINLAGEGIADRPWSAQRKALLRASRVNLTEELVTWIRRAETRPKVLISGSAVGWYGDQGETILEESSPAHEEYQHTLCDDWEQAARAVERLKVRLCIVRTGIVLGRQGGMLKRLLPLFGLGLGAKLGSGQQWLSWISLSDYVDVIRLLLEQENLSGIFNATAPKPVTNAEFTATLARLIKRPAFLTIPEPVLQFAMGEMACLLLTGQRVVPTRLLEQKFYFNYRVLEDALQAEVGR